MTPSPTIATRRPRLQLGHLGVLVLGQDLSHELVEPQGDTGGLCHLAGIAGDHHDPPAHPAQLGHRLGRLWPDRVLEGESTDYLVPAHEERTAAPRARH